MPNSFYKAEWIRGFTSLGRPQKHKVTTNL